MSDANAQAAADAAPPKKSKRLLIIGGAAAALLGGGGFAAWKFLLAPKPESEDEDDEDDGADAALAEARKKASFQPLDPFVVNLADTDADRYAQVGVVLEVAGGEAGAKLTERMPVVRNEVLLLLSSKKAEDLLSRPGKELLAGQIALSVGKALGYRPRRGEEEELLATYEAAMPRKAAADATTEPGPAPRPAAPKKPKDKKGSLKINPVLSVHFSQFIVQ